MSASTIPHQLVRPSYLVAEAARLVGLSPGRVRRWLRGYEYSYRDGVRDRPPVLKGAARQGSHASFLDLIDMLFVKRFLDHGVSLQRIRRALENGQILQLMSGGQWTIAPVIRELAAQIDFESSSELARRWYPLGRDGCVVLDPMVAYGAPSIAGRGVKTINVHDLFVAESESIAAVRSWWDLTEDQVEAAVEFERRLAA